DVGVDERLQLGRLVSHEKRTDEQKDLRLTFAEIAHQLYESADVALLLAHHDRGRMLARAREPRAVARTRDLHEAFGAAAHRADLVAERRTAASRATLAAERTQHSRALLYNSARKTSELIGTRLALTSGGCEPVLLYE